MKILIAALVGGLIAFSWGAFSHMVLPIGEMGLKSLPNEDPVIATMRTSISEPGLYFFPGTDPQKSQTPEEEAAWMNKYRTGPTGLLVYRPVGGEPMTAKMFIFEFVSGALASFVAALVVSWTVGTYGRKVLVVTLLGLFCWFSMSLSYWNWYGFPTAHLMGEGLDQVIGWTLVGLAVAKIAGRGSRSV